MLYLLDYFNENEMFSFKKKTKARTNTGDPNKQITILKV
jgi:hypothetical protein